MPSLKPQCTIEKTAEIRGRGLFTGEQVTLRFNPAPADSGIVFVRADAPSPVRIPAHVENVTKRSRRTSLRNGTLSIETVEHCLAAMHGLGIDNVEIELTGGELPGGDGSSQVFVDALQSAGIVDLPAERHPLVIDQTIRVAEGDAELIALPGSPEELNILYDLDYGDSGPIRRQIYALRLSPESFCREIAPARTFVLEEEAQQFRAAGLGLHLTYSDLVVIGQNGVVENEFRFENECVRHKILDLIGDLMLAGRPIYGKIIARKSGHSLNHELVRKLLEALEARELSRLLGREPVLDVRKIQRILPHRYPFLLVDRVLEIEGDRRAVGLKNVSINEEFFQGHYPAQPIMPGVLIIEAMAQLAGLLLSQKLEHTGKVAVLLAMDGVKFRRPVIPGDQLILEARTLRVRSRTGHVQCSARVGDAMVAQAEIKFMLVDAEPQ
ncbi:MAG: UDP-3-O-[3-hydroxymyristoyl] N-acetylglucosamine deacetylase [Phycisphaerae bacterium]|nr:UDP-3-O-[3-hydroxymyristoyl] N-acetylglucosamine deacetylase [Phycisphaerae bacterium]